MNQDNQNELKIMASPCSLQINDEQPKEGILCLYEDKIVFKIIRPMLKEINLLSLELSQIKNIKLQDEVVTINADSTLQYTFLNFQNSVKDIYNKINSGLSQLISKSLIIKAQQLSWAQFRTQQQQFLDTLIKLPSGLEYGKLCASILNDVSISEVFDIIFTDQCYQPSQFMKLGSKKLLNYDNPMHYLCQELVGDRLFTSTVWSPQIPRYLQLSDENYIPQIQSNINELPERQFVMQHPTKIPLIGTIYPKVTMTQKLILLDENEFWITTTTQINDMLYADNFKLRGYYRIKQVSTKQFQIETRQCVEWKYRLFIISHQIDIGAAKEYDNLCINSVLPFLKERNQEIIMLRDERQQLKNDQQMQQLQIAS